MPSETVSEAFIILQKGMTDRDIDSIIFACGMVHGENVQLRSRIKRLEERLSNWIDEKNIKAI